MLTAALAYAGAGWSVFPLHSRGKAPATRHGHLDATTDEDQIREWWTRRPDANVGLSCGPSGLVVIDVDAKHAANGWTTWLALCDQHGAEPRTFEVDTPSGGGHLYFAAPDTEIRNSASTVGEGIDVRGVGGYVVAAPSATDAGRYEVAEHRELSPLPGWLLELLRPPKIRRRPRRHVGWTATASSAYGKAALEEEAARVAASPEGQRHDTLNVAAFKIGQLVGGGQLQRSEAEPALVDAALASGLGDREAETTTADALSAGEDQPRRPVMSGAT